MIFFYAVSQLLNKVHFMKLKPGSSLIPRLVRLRIREQDHSDSACLLEVGN